MKFPSVPMAVLLLALMAGQSSAREGNDGLGWTAYRNERYGFILQYPADVFAIDKTSEAGDGAVFATADGQAKLLVGALPNDRAANLRSAAGTSAKPQERLAIDHLEDGATALKARGRYLDRPFAVGDVTAIVASPGEGPHVLCGIDLVWLLI